MTSRRFQSSIPSVLLLMVILAAVFAVLAFAIPQMIGQSNIGARVWFSRNGAPILLIAIVVGVAAGLLLGFHSGYRVLELGDEEVRIREGLRRPRAYRYADTRFVAQITRNRTNGIPSGTARALVVTSPAGTRTIRTPGIRPARFDELVHLLQHGGPAQLAAAPAAEQAGYFTPVVVQPPRGGRLPVGRLIGAIVFGVLALVSLVVAILVPEVEGLVVMGVLGLAFAGVAVAFVLSGRARRVPQRVEVTGSSLAVDDWVAPIAELERVELVPPELTGGLRQLVAVRRDGSRTTWSLGAAPAAEGAADPFPDYPRLVAAIAAVRPAEPLLRYMMR